MVEEENIIASTIQNVLSRVDATEVTIATDLAHIYRLLPLADRLSFLHHLTKVRPDMVSGFAQVIYTHTHYTAHN